MSTNYTPGSNNGPVNNNGSYANRREARANNMTGSLPPLAGITGVERSYGSLFDFDEMIESLHELFEHDRQVASQTDSTRCGICYLHFSLSELHYREEGFYVCPGCERNVGNQRFSMLRRQQKL